jgi:hypothetical protein
MGCLFTRNLCRYEKPFLWSERLNRLVRVAAFFIYVLPDYYETALALMGRLYLTRVAAFFTLPLPSVSQAIIPENPT